MRVIFLERRTWNRPNKTVIVNIGDIHSVTIDNSGYARFDLPGFGNACFYIKGAAREISPLEELALAAKEQ
jgi:hypothetical protein